MYPCGLTMGFPHGSVSSRRRHVAAAAEGEKESVIPAIDSYKDRSGSIMSRSLIVKEENSDAS